jgi:hypothetical protein
MMDIEERISIVKDLIAKREEIDRQLAELFGGTIAESASKTERKCKTCGELGHTARTCQHGKISAAPASRLGAPE